MEILRFLQLNLAMSFSIYSFFICFYILAYYAFFIRIFEEKSIIYIINTFVFYQLLLYVLQYVTEILIKRSVFQLYF